MNDFVIDPQQTNSNENAQFKILNHTHNNKYTDVLSARKLFVEWWPVVARVVINSLFSDISARQHAVRILKPLAEKLNENTTSLDAADVGIYALRDLYKGRLNMDAHEIHTVTTRWLDAIRTCFTHCQEIIQTHATIKKKN